MPKEKLVKAGYYELASNYELNLKRLVLSKMQGDVRDLQPK